MDIKTTLNLLDDWVLEQKGRRLDLLEKQILAKCYEGKRYEDIESELRYAPGTIKKNNGPALLKLLSEVIGESIHKKTLFVGLETALQRRIEKNGTIAQSEPISTDKKPKISNNSPFVDLNEAPVVSDFCGRLLEQKQLKHKIITERCRLVVVQGMVGIGKTYLTAKLTRDIQNDFEYVIWKTLRSRPSFNELLKELIEFLCASNELEVSLSQLTKCLQAHRCLIILDDLEMVHDEEIRLYYDLLDKIATVSHQSCLLLNSREMPKTVDLLPIDSVYSLLLQGDAQIAQKIFQDKNLSNPEIWLEVITLYKGHPAALKFVASRIQNEFNGDVSRFVPLNTVVNALDYLLESRPPLKKFSELEKNILVCLASHPHSFLFGDLKDELQLKSSSKLIDALGSLRRRSLVEKTGDHYTVEPLVRKWIQTEYLD